jgi:integrase
VTEQEEHDMQFSNLKKMSSGVFRIRMRHPALPGKMIDRSCNTTEIGIAARISEALEALKHPNWHDPSKENEAARLYNAVAVEAFYKPLRAVDPEINFTPRIMAVHLEQDGALEYAEPYQTVADNYTKLLIEHDLLRRKCDFLERELSRLGHSPHNKQTLAAAFDRWSKEFHSKSERQRKAVVRRAKFVVEALGPVSFEKLTLAAVNDAINKSLKVVRSRNGMKAQSLYERSYRIREIKRLLAWVATEFELKAIGKIASSLHAQSAQTIARSQNGDVGILDLVAVERFLSITDAKPYATLQAAVYWRALIASLVYAGLRLGELCALRWQDVNFVGQILSVKDTEIKATKTTASNRPIKPLPELWSFLQTLQPVTGTYEFVFPAFLDGAFKPESWLVEEDGKMIAVRLTRALIRDEVKIGLGRKIPQRARRTCRGLMLTRGVPGHVCDLMLGHSNDVGAAHYTNALQVVSAFKFA